MILDIDPVLTSEEGREFLEPEAPRSEKTMLVESRGSDLVVEYGSDAPFDLWVSFPVGAAGRGGEGDLTFNPLHTLKVDDLQPLDQARISIDLTNSPAWSPRRNRYLLHVRGAPESTVLIRDIEVRAPTFLKSLRALVSQFMTDEPAILSTASFLSGYRALGMSTALVFGLLLLLAVAGALARNPKSGIRNPKRVVLICLLFILLYDARFSLDLLRTNAADLKQWRMERQYRQLGPIHAVANALKDEEPLKNAAAVAAIRKSLRFATVFEPSLRVFQRFHEQKSVGDDMSIAMCFDGADFLLKQLRYLMYPAPVGRAEDIGDEATHLVLIDTARGAFENDIVSCGEKFQRSATSLAELPQQTRVFRFTD